MITTGGSLRPVCVMAAMSAVCRTYVILAPQIVRAGSTYDVIVTIFRARSNVTVDVRLQTLRNISVVSNRTVVSAG